MKIVEWFDYWFLKNKTVVKGVKIFVVLIFAFMVYRSFFMKATSVTVQKGGTAIINQARKRFFIPFIEGGIEQRQGTGSLNTYLRVGIRVEL